MSPADHHPAAADELPAGGATLSPPRACEPAPDAAPPALSSDEIKEKAARKALLHGMLTAGGKNKEMMEWWREFKRLETELRAARPKKHRRDGKKRRSLLQISDEALGSIGEDEPLETTSAASSSAPDPEPVSPHAGRYPYFVNMDVVEAAERLAEAEITAARHARSVRRRAKRDEQNQRLENDAA